VVRTKTSEVRKEGCCYKCVILSWCDLYKC